MKYLKMTTLALCLILSYSISAQSTPQLDLSAPASSIKTSTPEVKGPISTIEFASNEFEWGEILQGEKIQNVFSFVNTGDDPIVITNAKGSCGCTVPEWPREPIMPGESAEILVQFDSKNKGGLQSKRVTITANTDPVNTYLTIKGKVIKPDAADKVEVVRNETNFDVKPSTVAVFPNPASTELSVQLSDYKGSSALIEIYDMLGERVTQRDVVQLDRTPLLFDTSQYQNGTYVVVVKIEGKNRIAKQFTVLK